ncbi:hypothetical protein PG984_005377 [Apiospora sp. TS-2023a]
MQYSLFQVTTLLAAAGMASARSIVEKRGASTTLHGSMADVIDATNSLDHVVSDYSGGEAEEVDCAVSTAVTVLRHATEVAGNMSAPMSYKDAEDWKASTVKLCEVGDSLVKTFDGKIDAFNDARICNTITTHATRSPPSSRPSAPSSPPGSDAAFPAKTKTYFRQIKEDMDERCNACGVLNDAPYSGVPLGPGNGTTYGAGVYPGPPINSSGASSAFGVSCGGAMVVMALVAFLV